MSCTICKKRVKRLKQHMRDVHEFAPAECSICNKVFKTEKLLRCHMKNSHRPDVPVPKATCSICQTVVVTRKLKFHMEIFHFLPPDFASVCPLCYKGVKYMPWHLKKVHKKSNLRTDLFHCTKCRQYFASQAALVAHSRDHEAYICSQCGQQFSHFLELGGHLLADHGKVFSLGTRAERGPRPGPLPPLSDLPLYDVPANCSGVNNLESGAEDGMKDITVVFELEDDYEEGDDEEEDDDDDVVGSGIHQSTEHIECDPNSVNSPMPPTAGEIIEEDIIFIVTDDATVIELDTNESVEDVECLVDVEAAVPLEEEEDGLADNSPAVVRDTVVDPHLVCFVDDENRLGKESYMLIDFNLLSCNLYLFIC